MPWRLKFCQPLSGVFGAPTLRARHRAKFDVGFFVALYNAHHRNPIRGPPSELSVRNTMDEQQKQHDLTTQEEYHGTERRTDNGTKSADG